MLCQLSCCFLRFALQFKPPDEEHTYGHEKFETIGGLIGGVVLIAVAFLIFYEAAIRLIMNTQIVKGEEFAGFIAIGYALFIASLRVTVFRKAEHIQSPFYESWSLRRCFRFKLNFASAAGVWLSHFRLLCMEML